MSLSGEALIEPCMSNEWLALQVTNAFEDVYFDHKQILDA